MQIRKTAVVVSNMVDSTIKEYQPDVEFLIFKTIQDLSDYIERTPIRASVMYLTKDTMPDAFIRTNLTYLLDMLDNPFLRVDNIKYITEKDSPEISTFNYIIESKELSNWEVVKGSMTREYINAYINGILQGDDFQPKRKVVYRMPRDAYYQEMREEKLSLKEPFETDEEYLKNIPDVEMPVEIMPETATPCDIKHIVGIDSKERTALAFLCAQYLSLSGKTVILERDVEYHTLGTMVSRSGVEPLIILIPDLIQEPERWIDVIKHTDKSLICILTKKRVKYSYSFLVNVMYNNLIEDIRFFVREGSFQDTPANLKTTVSVPSNIIGILQTCEQLDRGALLKSNFVGVNLGDLPQMNIGSSESIQVIIEDLLATKGVNVINVNISSLQLKNNAADLNKIF